MRYQYSTGGFYEEAIEAALKGAKTIWEGAKKAQKEKEAKEAAKKQPKDKTATDKVVDAAKELAKGQVKQAVRESVPAWVWIALGYLILKGVRR